MQTDTQQRLDRSLKTLLGEHSLLIKTHTYDEVLDKLLAARNSSNSTSIEFNGNMEPLCQSRLGTAGFRFDTFKNNNDVIVTRISW